METPIAIRIQFVKRNLPLWLFSVSFILMVSCASLNNHQHVDFALKKQKTAEFYLENGNLAASLTLFKDALNSWEQVSVFPGNTSAWWKAQNIERCENAIDQIERQLRKDSPRKI